MRTMESWDVIVIGAGPSAQRAAIASHDSGAKTVMIHQAPGTITPPSVAGLATSLGEISPESHIEDTMGLGDPELNEATIRRICSSAVEIVAELEQWGMIFRRDESGMPHLSEAPGHKSSRLSGAGDSTNRYVTKILDEQLLKRALQRRQSNVPLSLIMDNGQVRGLVTLDLMDGEVKAFQCKSIILACEGYQGLWTSVSAGSGNAIALAIRAGIEPQRIADIPFHPMVIRGTSIPIPYEVLSAGGRYRSESGDDIDPLANEGDAVIDLRFIEKEELPWLESIRKVILDSTGLNTSVDVVPVTPGVVQTTGGLPVDELGRVTMEDGKMWATGVFAAGSSASTGFHGSKILPGNLLLANLSTGATTGNEAGTWAKNCQFGGTKLIMEGLEDSRKMIENLNNEDGISVGSAEARIMKQAKSFLSGEISAESFVETGKKVSNSVRTTSSAGVMNQEIASALRIIDLGTIVSSIPL